MRAPLRTVPQVDWVNGGSAEETPGYRVLRPRGVSDHLLIHSRQGAGRFGSPGASDLRADPGTLTLIKPDVPHDYGIADDAATWVIGFCHFHPRADWQVLLSWPEPRPGIGRLEIGGQLAERMASALDQAGAYSRSAQPRARLFAMNALEQALLWCDTQNPLAGRIEERIVAVLEFMERRLADPLTVARLAAVAHLSPSRFAHLFAEQIGTTPLAHLERQRMTVARQLLEQTSRPVAEVAAAVGFVDPLYFSTRFRRFVGSSPSQYRRSRTG